MSCNPTDPARAKPELSIIFQLRLSGACASDLLVEIYGMNRVQKLC